MGNLYDVDHQRETRSLLTLLTGPSSSLSALWKLMGFPFCVGVNLNFAELMLESGRLRGDIDLLGIPLGKDGRPSFREMFAVEVKAVKLSLDKKLKSTGSKLREAEAQCGKLERAGFSRVASVFVIITENKPENDRGGSSGFWSATDRAWDAVDAMRAHAQGKSFRYPTFMLPWGSHPSSPESRAGAGELIHIGGPKTCSPAYVPQAGAVSILEKMIGELPRPIPQELLAFSDLSNVFGRCPDCVAVTQYFAGGRLCWGCGGSLLNWAE